jgi:adenine-specific DNA-methyltransferase
MRTKAKHQKLPASGPAREALRVKGQFWTPDWVAEAMVSYAIAGGSDHIFDPAVGAGAFFRAAKTVAQERAQELTLVGTEIDPSVLQEARESGLTEADLQGVQIRDFMFKPPDRKFKAIVANPPYIRHHRLSPDVKAKLRAFGENLIGTPLDGRAGFHVYFFLRALQLLEQDGRLAFIMPADSCEGKFAPMLWEWVAKHYRIDGVVTFAPEAAPFPGVDTNGIVFMLRNAPPLEYFSWAQCKVPGTQALKEWAASDLDTSCDDTLVVHKRLVAEGIRTGLSRGPRGDDLEGPVLGDFARVMRGIATGANEFFFLTNEQAHQLKIPPKFLRRAVGRTRDVTGDRIMPTDLDALDTSGRPTYLLYVNGTPRDELPASVQDYLKHGEDEGIDKGTLISTRNPWYKMEARDIPAWFFAYLGRRNARFIRNYADALPLTGFLCVYPNENTPEYINKLWTVLQHPQTIANLPLVAKSYGDGALKVEPRSLEQLPLPANVVEEVGLGKQPAPANYGTPEVIQASFA